MQDSDGTAYQGLPWPDSYGEILPLIRNRWSVDGGLYLNRKLGGGRSGALVYAADIESASFTGLAILKLDQAPDSASREQLEAERHSRAISDAPDFAARHLPRLLQTLHHKEQVAVLSTIAGRGLEYAEPWTDCSFGRQIQIVKQVSRGLLEDWNQDFECDPALRQPWQLLQAWLGYRIEPSQGGRLHDFLSDRCGFDPLAPSVSVDGEWYPNPLAFAVGAGELPQGLGIRAISGHCHGDFHGLNVLVGGPQASGPDYYLIDLAYYESEQYLFYDHAYFEAAYLLNSRANANASDWMSIVRRLGREHDGDEKRGMRQENVGLIEMVEALREEVGDWIGGRDSERQSDMEDQYLLARVSAGLNFAHKMLPDAMRQMAFVYAGSNLKAYLRRKEVSWPENGPSFELKQDLPQPASEPVTVIPADPDVMDQAASTIATSDVGSPYSERVRPLRETRLGAILRELRRRHVVKVAGLYLIVAWICVQVAVVIKGPLNLPVWTDTLVTVFAALGFPIACVVAWAFEISPDGVRRTGPDEPDGKSARRSGGLVDYVIAAGIIAIIIFSVAHYGFDHSGNQPTRAEGDLPSIAVLPFKNLSQNASDDTFNDGLTIEIMSTLARTRQFRIPGQTSTFRFKEQAEDLREIGKDLGVQYLLEGSVRRVGDDLRVEAQLIEADNGFLIWSDAFSDQVKDIFEIQEKIANAIGTALRTPLGVKAKGLRTGRTDKPVAYELFLSALALVGYQGEGVNAQIAQGIGLLRRSVTIDPNFAAGWAALSLAYDFGASFPHEIDGKTLTPAVYIKRASTAAFKAQRLDPDLALVQHAIGNVHRRAQQWTQAEDAYRTSLATEPNNSLALLDYARLLAILGHFDRAIALTEQTREIDPRNPLLGFSKSLYVWQSDPTAENAEKFLGELGKQPNFDPLILRSTMGYLFSTKQVDRLRKLLTECATCDASWRDQALKMIGEVGGTPADALFEANKESRFLGYPFLQFIGGRELVLKAFDYYTNDRSFVLQLFLVPWTQVGQVGKTWVFQRNIEDIGLDDYWRERGWPDHCRPLDGAIFECG